MMEKPVPPDLVVVAQLWYKFLAIPAAGHSKKFLHGKFFICTLHRGHLQVSSVVLLICILWIWIRVLSDSNMKLPICTSADCVISAHGGKEGYRVPLVRFFFKFIFLTKT
jgi:hypothetical protein